MKNINRNYLIVGSIFFVIILILSLVIVLISKNSNDNNSTNNMNLTTIITSTMTTSVLISKDNCVAEDCLKVDVTYPVSLLPQEVKDTLNLALNDEYKAYSFYNEIIKKFGNVRPFSMIIRAEEQHISSLKALYDKYGLSIPENPYLNKLTASGSVQIACQTGVDAEIANADLYKTQLLPKVQSYPDIVSVYTTLYKASEENHLPAFQKCS